VSVTLSSTTSTGSPAAVFSPTLEHAEPKARTRIATALGSEQRFVEIKSDSDDVRIGASHALVFTLTRATNG
jgi:hypothetical protein